MYLTCQFTWKCLSFLSTPLRYFGTWYSKCFGCRSSLPRMSAGIRSNEISRLEQKISWDFWRNILKILRQPKKSLTNIIILTGQCFAGRPGIAWFIILCLQKNICTNVLPAKNKCTNLLPAKNTCTNLLPAKNTCTKTGFFKSNKSSLRNVHVYRNVEKAKKCYRSDTGRVVPHSW